MDKVLSIPYIDWKEDLNNIPENAAEINISKENWIYLKDMKPVVKVKLWHTGKNLFLFYEVEEPYIMALETNDNGKVCKDSCVECFISLGPNGYYNIEANCIGKILFSHREGRKINVEYGNEEIMSKIIRVSSLGSEKISGIAGWGKWNLFLKIPAEVFYKDGIRDFSGVKGKANFYKCGDMLPQPHFLSWKELKSEHPNFHLPEFFGEIEMG